MKRKDYIYSIPPYQAGKKVRGALKLASNENPMGPSPLAVQALRDRLHEFNLYPEGSCRELKNRLAEVHQSRPECLLLGNGSDEIFSFIGLGLISPGDNAVTGAPTFSQYRFAVETNGGTMKTVPLKDGVYDLDGILQTVDERTRAVFICNPNNPTGRAVPSVELDAFLEKIAPEVLIVVDEAYIEYADPQVVPGWKDRILEYPNLLVTRTFSKIYGLAGLRVGYAFGNPELIDYLSRVRGPFNVNLPAQIGALAALDDVEFVEKSKKVNREGKKQLYTALEDFGYSYYPTQGNFICVQVGMPAEEAYSRILENGVTIRALTSFGLPESIRLTVGTQEQNSYLIRAMQKGLFSGE